MRIEEFEDNKVVIRIRKSKKNRKHNDQKRKGKRRNNDVQNIHIKLKIEYHQPYSQYQLIYIDKNIAYNEGTENKIINCFTLIKVKYNKF